MLDLEAVQPARTFSELWVSKILGQLFCMALYDWPGDGNTCSMSLMEYHVKGLLYITNSCNPHLLCAWCKSGTFLVGLDGFLLQPCGKGVCFYIKFSSNLYLFLLHSLSSFNGLVRGL